MKIIKKYKKEILIGIASLLTVIFIISLISMFKHKKVEAPSVTKNLAAPILQIPKVPIKRIYRKRKVVISTPVNPETILNEVSYTEAFMKYHNGHIIQFSDNCQSSPVRLAVAKGSDLMLDNRSPVKEVISIGDKKYALDPYGFWIIHLDSPKTSVTNLIDCSISKNVNTLIVE